MRLGGTDIATILDKNKYGCKRAIWYREQETPPDFPNRKSVIMDLGNVLEEYIVTMFADKMAADGVPVRVRDANIDRHEEAEWLDGHPDRLIVCEDGSTGVLECKSCGSGAWWAFQGSGLPARYIYQLQAYLFQCACDVGYYAVLNRDSGAFRSFPVERSDKIVEQILSAGADFVGGDIPDKLKLPDNRCNKCPWRSTCQNLGADEHIDDTDDEKRPTDTIKDNDKLAELHRQYTICNEDIKMISKQRDVIRKEMLEHMTKRYGGNIPSGVSYGDGEIRYTQYMQERLDRAALRAEMPEVYQKYRSNVIRERLS